MNAETLVRDIRKIAHEAEHLIKATADDVSDKVREARERLRDAIEAAKESCEVLQEKAAAGARATDRVIRRHPYQAIGIAFGIGLLIGVLVARRD
jgi:ElaB/YqjD/DUF883 family membrane-anchored ribosome-binding protein